MWEVLLWWLSMYGYISIHILKVITFQKGDLTPQLKPVMEMYIASAQLGFYGYLWWQWGLNAETFAVIEFSLTYLLSMRMYR